jgi:hypothetical protein
MRNVMVTAVISTLFICSVFAQHPAHRIAIVHDGFELSVSAPLLNKEIIKTGSNSVVDYTEYTDPSQPGTFKLPSQDLIIAIPAGSRPIFSLQVEKSNVLKNSSVKLNPELVAKNSTDYIEVEQTRPRVSNTSGTAPRLQVVRYFWFRDLYCAQLHIRLADYSYANNTIEEITAYKVSVSLPGSGTITPAKYVEKTDFDKNIASIIANSDMAESFRSRFPRQAGDPGLASWFTPGQPYLKIGVIEDRIYRITKQQIEALGFSTTGIDPKTFQLFESGKEMPITVSGEQSGVFGSSDYIEFYGKKNYGAISARIVNPDSLPYNEYMNPYSDTSVYFLTWGAKSGMRSAIVPTAISSATDSLTYFTQFSHYEADTLYQPAVNDNILRNDPLNKASKSWFWGYLFTQTDQAPRQFKFSTVDAVTGKQGHVWAKLISDALSYKLTAHALAIGLKTNPANASDTNVTILQTASAGLNKRIVLQGDFDASSLQKDSSIVVVKNWNINGITPNDLLFDWCEIEYPKTIKAVNDSLYFELRDTVTSGLRKIVVSNVQKDVTDLTIYRVKPSFALITGAVKNGTTLYFTDTVSTGAGWYLIPTQNITAHTPLSLKKKVFADLRNASHSADYIAITNPALFTSARNYTGFIHDNYGVDTALVMIDDIYDEFAYGYPVPESIKSFLQAVFASWQKQPTYLALLGHPCYDYKNNTRNTGYTIVNRNLVPSFSEPISDPWFAMLNANDPYIPQMLVGRLPVSTDSELNDFLTKHKNYLKQRNDLFNKRALVFAGGLDSLECVNLHTKNQALISKYIAPAPGAYNYVDFYKLKPTDKYGPLQPTVYDQEISKGGLFIAYLGHSGTQTWDNGIEAPNNLLNSSNKSPLVTDFGCSTNKIAEPNVKAFGDLFVNGGQSLAYIGNTSLGFTLTSYIAPEFFYSSLLRDTVRNIARSHLYAKISMLNTYGSSGVYHIFAMTNILVGDPILRLASPSLPNLSITSSSIQVKNVGPQTDGKAAADTVQIVYNNLGTATTDSIDLRFEDHYQIANHDSVLTRLDFRRPPLNFSDTVVIILPTTARAGAHTFTVQLDRLNKIDEIYKDDNSAAITTYISSLSTRDIIPGNFSSLNSTLTILSASSAPDSKTKEMLVQFDTTGRFSTPLTQKFTIDTFFTKISLAGLKTGKRFWGRTSLNQIDTMWSNPFVFYKSDKLFPFYLEDSLSFSSMQLNHLQFNSGLKIAPSITEITIGSGNHQLKKSSLVVNGVEYFGGINWGMACAIIDPLTYHVDFAQAFYYGGNAALADSLAAVISRTPNGKYVCLMATDDAKTNFNTNLKNAIVSCGSKQVDALGFLTSWYLFGVKGAAPGSVPEKTGDATSTTMLSFDTSFVNYYPDSIGLKTIQISQAGKYNSVYMNATIPANTNITVTPIGYTTNGTAVPLAPLSFNASGIADISTISTTLYPTLAFSIQYTTSPGIAVPTLKTFAVDYAAYPELGINYQSVATESDSFSIGKQNKFFVSVNNAGTVKADSVKVIAQIVYQDNSSQTLDTRTIPSLAPESRYDYSIPYGVPLGYKDRTFRVTIDPDNKIKEFYKDNNTYNLPFSIATDTTLKPAVDVTFDSVHIFDGDYVSTTPKITIEINDPSTQAINDTSFASIYLDDQRVPFNSLKTPPAYYTFNPKMVITYTPNLSSGDHQLRIIGLSATKQDTLTVEKQFTVNSDLQLLSVYNYPNPMKDKTWFTFVLPQVPDELQIRIYTIAGRLIRKINKTAANLNIGFNKSVFWDGRDEDGDQIANGIYLYKMIAKRNGKTSELVSKLAIVR